MGELLMVSLLGYTVVQLLALGFAGASAIVGLIIGYQAYRGLQRNQSRQMLFLATGMILLFGVAYGVSFLGTFLFQFRVLELPMQDLFRASIRIIQFVALVCIAYSLYLRPNQET